MVTKVRKGQKLWTYHFGEVEEENEVYKITVALTQPDTENEGEFFIFDDRSLWLKQFGISNKEVFKTKKEALIGMYNKGIEGIKQDINFLTKQKKRYQEKLNQFAPEA